MGCDRSRELISAELDGELGDGEREELARHLDACEACAAFAGAAAAVHRSQRLAPAAEVPDLTDAILRRAEVEGVLPVASPSEAAARSPRRRLGGRRSPAAAGVALQYGLLVVALLMAVLAIPDLFASGGDAAHASRHLGGWDLAFAVGLVLAALQPWRARGLLPMAVALVGVMVVTAVVDIARGATPGQAEGAHLLEVLGLLFLWLLARSSPAGARPGRGAPARGDDPGTAGARPRLRVLAQRFGVTAASGRVPARARDDGAIARERTAA